MSSCSSPQCNFEAFEPRQSLWKLVEEFLPFEEQREIKEVLGVDIIDETADLHKEVFGYCPFFHECCFTRLDLQPAEIYQYCPSIFRDQNKIAK